MKFHACESFSSSRHANVPTLLIHALCYGSVEILPKPQPGINNEPSPSPGARKHVIPSVLASHIKRIIQGLNCVKNGVNWILTRPQWTHGSLCRWLVILNVIFFQISIN